MYSVNLYNIIIINLLTIPYNYVAAHTTILQPPTD